MPKSLVISLFAALSLSPLAVHGQGLFFSVSGDDLIITAREADNSAQYWSLTITQGAAVTPAAGPKGAITGFYDLTGAPGSNPSFNLARGSGLLTTHVTAASTGFGTVINDLENTVLYAPEWVDGTSSYTFTLSTTFPDYERIGVATFTSQITINAPTFDGTLFTVSNQLITPPEWSVSDAIGQGGRESRSALATFFQTMQGGVLESYNGWRQSPRDPNQWARATATADSIGFADGRSFYLSQTANLSPSSIATANQYVPVNAEGNALVLTQMLSGRFRGSADAGSNLGSVGFLHINIAAVPEPSTYAAFAGIAALWITFLRRRKRAHS